MTALPDSYHPGGFGGRLTLGRRPAVVVVDLQNAFTRPDEPFGAEITDALLATRTLLDDARRRDVPVVFTTIAYTDPAAAGPWAEKVTSLGLLLEGSPLVNIDERLARAPDEPVVRKPAASGFAGTPLAALLTSAGIDTVVVCGATTSGCVRATVVDAISHGFRPVVPRECVADRAVAPHEASLFDMQAKYAEVMPLDAVRAHLATVPRPDTSVRLGS